MGGEIEDEVGGAREGGQEDMVLVGLRLMRRAES
jgi:hypothetical protein